MQIMPQVDQLLLANHSECTAAGLIEFASSYESGQRLQESPPNVAVSRNSSVGI